MTESDYKTEGQSAQFSSQLQSSQYAQCEKCDPLRVHESYYLSLLGKIADQSLFEPRHDKTNKMSVRPAKTQISLGIRPV